MAKWLLRAVPVLRSYTDFEPRSQLQQAEESNTLVVDLSGFNKEQLRVTINTSGSLKIFGQRPMDGSRWARFVKHFTVPKYPDIPKGIEAKFDKEEGRLYVVLPKLASNDKHTSPRDKLPAHTRKTLSGSEAAAADEHRRADEMSNGAGGVMQSSRQGMTGTVMGVSKRKLLVANVVVAVMVLVGVGIYFGFKMRFFRGGDQN